MVGLPCGVLVVTSMPMALLKSWLDGPRASGRWSFLRSATSGVVPKLIDEGTRSWAQSPKSA